MDQVMADVNCVLDFVQGQPPCLRGECNGKKECSNVRN